VIENLIFSWTPNNRLTRGREVLGSPEFLYRVQSAWNSSGGGGPGSWSFPVTRNRPMRGSANVLERHFRPGGRPSRRLWHPAPSGRRRGSVLWREGCYSLAVETGEARKGAVVRSTSDAGGITGWRRWLGHLTWKECPS